MSSILAGLQRLCNARRTLFLLLVAAGILEGNLVAAPVAYSIESLGGNTYRYTYQIPGITLLANMELAIEFDPLLYENLSDGAAGAGFHVELWQPIVDPGGGSGVPGLFSALALVDFPPVLPFGVTVEFLGSGMPGSQPYTINQFNEVDGELVFQSTLLSGQTIPEPAGVQLVTLGLLGSGAFWVFRRRRNGAT